MIVFAWNLFPQYAARCIGAFARTTDEPVAVVATRPDVPIEGMERECGCPVYWVERGREGGEKRWRWTKEITTLFTTGWNVPAFNQLRDLVRKQGGRTICLVDNNFIPSFREVIKSIRFRLFIRRHYDGFIVPGKSARRLLRFYGVPDEKIAEGFYAADESLFRPGPALEERPKKIIYVGRFCERKNVRRMLDAFARWRKEVEVDSGWELHLYGSGPLKEEIAQTLKNSKTQTIHLHDFLQPEELAEKYRESRIFVLPSVEEHWGLVVHEAALSGCVLLLSNRVGAADDLLEEGVNGLTFDPFDVNDMAETLKAAMMRQFDTKTAAEKAREHGVDSFVTAMRGQKG